MAVWLGEASGESQWFGGADREPLTMRWWRDMAYPDGIPKPSAPTTP